MTAQHVNPLGLLAALVHTIRPNWDLPGITSALENAAGATDLATLATTAIDAAADHTAQTPAVIGWRITHQWRPGDPPDTTTAAPPEPRARYRCPQCSQPRAADGTCAC